TWVDNNGNFIPDCDLTSPNLQGPTQTGANQQVDTCGTVNPLFYSGLSTVTTVDPATGKTVGAGDDDARYGWGKRPYSWEFSVSNVIDDWNGFDLGVNMRLAHGIIVQGGTSTGHQITDNCDIVDPAKTGKFGNRSPLLESLTVLGTSSSVSECHVEQAWLTQ